MTSWQRAVEDTVTGLGYDLVDAEKSAGGLLRVYIDQRVDPSWRARAQALISLMSGGVGNLTGYLGTGAWFGFCNRSGNPDWVLF